MKITTSWDLSALGSSIKDPIFKKERKETEKAVLSFEKKWRTKTSYLKNPKDLREALDDYAKLTLIGEKEPRYLSLRAALETDNTEINAAMTLYRNYANQIMDHIRFFDLSLTKIPEATQKKLLASPLLKNYHNYLDGIFKSARYTLSEAEEKILSMKSSVSSGNWVDMLDEFISAETRAVYTRDEKTQKVIKKELSFSEILSNLKDQHTKISESAQNAVEDILRTHAKVAEKEINSFLENKSINDQLRGYERPDSSRHINEGIDTKAVDTLVETVTNNFKVSQDFYAFKAKLVGKKSFTYWNRNVEYGSLSKSYSYEQGVELVSKALSHISDEFVNIFHGYVQNGQIDVYPKKGKTGGAFSSSSYHLPGVVMLNHTGGFREITTLAHEMGHAIHGVKARGENPLNYDHPMCTAEVASTFCEDFVIDELQMNANESEQLALMVGQLDDKVGTIFRQIAAYNFEKELHETFRVKGYLPNKEIGKMFNKHMKSYLGPSVDLDENSGNGWVYWGHFRSPFYVYSYSMALLVAQFARRHFKQDSAYIEKINEFYSTGSSITPAQIFTNLGLDVNDQNRWQEGIDEVKDLLARTKKLAKKLGKI